MSKRLDSFLVRCWQLGDDEQRIEIEHIQSGRKELTRSAAAAVAWMCALGCDAEQSAGPLYADADADADAAARGTA